METHDKIDVIVLMLGTNELKFDFNNEASAVVIMMKKYVDFIKNLPESLYVSGLEYMSSVGHYLIEKIKSYR